MGKVRLWGDCFINHCVWRVTALGWALILGITSREMCKGILTQRGPYR